MLLWTLLDALSCTIVAPGVPVGGCMEGLRTRRDFFVPHTDQPPALMLRTSLLSLVADFQRFKNDRAIVFSRGYRRTSWTYEKLTSAAVAFANALKSRGIRTNDRLLLWAPNSAEWVATFWACQLLGAVPVPMDDSAPPDFPSRVARDSLVRLILAARGKPPLAAAIPVLTMEDLSDISAIAGQHRVFISSNVPRETSQPLRETLWDVPLTRQNLAESLFTSGTTAEPRGVVLTHGNFLANLEPIEQGIKPYLKYERFLHPLRFVSLVPLSHVFGQFMALFVPSLLGATIVFENSPNPAEILRTIRRERATVLVAVPRMLDLVRSALEREIDSRGWGNWFERNYSTAESQPFLHRAWRFRRIHRLLGFRFWAFISGGAALSSETEFFFKRLGYAVVQGYGMTETASLISLNHPFSAAEGSVGKILPGREFKIAEDGEILVRSENVSTAYWEKGSLQDSSQENGGWLRTGDLGELDSNGNLKFRGRKKNVIVTAAGLNIYPEDLEAALKKQPAVRDAVVIPIHSNGNAEPCAVLLPLASATVIPRATRNLSSQLADGVEAAIASANSALAQYQQVRSHIVWPDLDFPRTATGKPRLAAIAARAAELLSVLPGLSPVASAVSTSQFDPLAKVVSSGSLDSLSSLDRVELLSALEHRYNIEINESAFSEAKSVADLQKLIAQPQTNVAAQSSTAENSRTEVSRASKYHYPRWAQRELIRLFRLFIYYALVWPATQILAHPKVVGREHLKNLRGPFIIVSNH